MILLLLIIPGYVFIGDLLPPQSLHVPILLGDGFIPLQPAWALVYGSLYLFVLLPFLILRDADDIRRTALAYLTLWITAYICFIAYPTAAPHPEKLIAHDFFAWDLQMIYSADVPANCFPSLHVAQSVLSAFICFRIHRRVGIAALLWASLIALSTLFTKQHYVADVIAGIAMACVAYAVFLRGRRPATDADRRTAPAVALTTALVHVLIVIVFVVAYEVR